MTISFLIAALFAAGAIFAAATMAATLRAYWPAVRALRDPAASLVEEDEVCVTARLIQVTQAAEVARPRFRPARPAAGTWRAAA